MGEEAAGEDRVGGRVVAVLLGLLGFALVYLALLAGCVAAPLALIGAAWRWAWLWPLASVATPVFGILVAVLVRGLVARPGLGPARSITLAPADAPRLFAFVADLAARAGAPMPARIHLSPGVNAAMLRRSSAAALLLGGERELLLGLGLVHSLDRRELAAVLAHELGHFAQSSARVGQWAHRSLVLLRTIVLGRGRLDERLVRARAGGAWPLRWLAIVALVGVTGLRTLLARTLAGLTRASLGLARAMELDADRHAVALCGSDPLVAALWRAQRGAVALAASLGALRELAKHAVVTDDLYVHLDARLAELDAGVGLGADAAHGQLGGEPAMLAALRRPYVDGPARHFPPGAVPAEILGYSHPSYAEREANAKTPYVAVEAGGPGAGPGSSWALFDDPAALRREATTLAYAELGVDLDGDRRAPAPAAEVEARLAEELAERAQDRGYFGFYANRLIDADLDAAIALGEAASLAALAAAAAPWRAGSSDLDRFMRRWRATDAALDRLRERLLDAQRRGTEPAAETLALIQAAEHDRAEQRCEAALGDRRLLAWLWRLADGPQRAELARRVRFLAFVQAQILTLNRHRATVVPLAARERDDPAHAAELDAALAALHADLTALLRAAEDQPLPELALVAAGTTTRGFLLDEPLVGAWTSADGASLAAWLAAAMPQVSRVHDRLRSLHYKNLGRLLGLFAAIEQYGHSDKDHAD